MSEETPKEVKELSDKELEELVAYAFEVEEPKIEGEPFYKKPRKLWHNFTVAMKKVGQTASREKKETIIAARILRRYITHNDITDEEKKFLKEQSIDLARIIPIVLVQAVPAPVPITPFLIMFGKKVGINLVPKEQKIPDSTQRISKKEKKDKDFDNQ